MRGIEIKSIGTLIDEDITTDLKIKYVGEKPEFLQRKRLLTHAINERLKQTDINIFMVGSLIAERLYPKIELLRNTLEKCWLEQEKVMNLSNDYCDIELDCYKDIALAAINAQKLNAKRNLLIRQIDDLLGESKFTQLEKSYG